jgi:cell division protein FtsN
MPPDTIYNIDPAYIIPGITTPPEKERPPENTIYNIDPAYIIPGITIAPPEKEPEKQQVSPPVIDNTFSVRRITQLDRGSFYVQIASYDGQESVENTLRQIDGRYNPVVYKVNNAYHILLGPYNQGESAAVLQRFKSIGYKNAFIRHEK